MAKDVATPGVAFIVVGLMTGLAWLITAGDKRKISYSIKQYGSVC